MPAAVTLYENLPSVASTDDETFLSALTTLCGTSSRLVYVTAVLAGISIVCGLKLKLAVVIVLLGLVVASAFGA